MKIIRTIVYLLGLPVSSPKGKQEFHGTAGMLCCSANRTQIRRTRLMWVWNLTNPNISIRTNRKKLFEPKIYDTWCSDNSSSGPSSVESFIMDIGYPTHCFISFIAHRLVVKAWLANAATCYEARDDTVATNKCTRHLHHVNIRFLCRTYNHLLDSLLY